MEMLLGILVDIVIGSILFGKWGSEYMISHPLSYSAIWGVFGLVALLTACLSLKKKFHPKMKSGTIVLCSLIGFLLGFSICISIVYNIQAKNFAEYKKQHESNISVTNRGANSLAICSDCGYSRYFAILHNVRIKNNDTEKAITIGARLIMDDLTEKPFKEIGMVYDQSLREQIEEEFDNTIKHFETNHFSLPQTLKPNDEITEATLVFLIERREGNWKLQDYKKLKYLSPEEREEEDVAESLRDAGRHETKFRVEFFNYDNQEEVLYTLRKQYFYY